eukprot:scaffold41668_cov63-Phaeocystis_antarctica.AAC.5
MCMCRFARKVTVRATSQARSGGQRLDAIECFSGRSGTSMIGTERPSTGGSASSQETKVLTVEGMARVRARVRGLVCVVRRGERTTEIGLAGSRRVPTGPLLALCYVGAALWLLTGRCVDKFASRADRSSRHVACRRSRVLHQLNTFKP